MMRHASAFCLIATLIVGCSSSLETNGQVFIDTSGSATKVAQAEIYVVSEEALVNNLKSSITTLKSEYQRLQATHKNHSDYLARTVGQAQQARDLAVGSSMLLRSPSVYPGSNADLAASTNTLIENASKYLIEAKRQFEESEASLTGLANGSNADFFLPKAIQGAPIAATSDADGKFKLTLETGKRVAIIARKDKLAWLIWMNPKKGDQIFLTDRNLNGTQCDACVFNKSQLDSTLAFIPAAFSSAQTK